MATTIRQTVTVQPGGRVTLQSPDLRDGESVQIIATVEHPPTTSIPDRLSALRGLRDSLNLKPDDADRWVHV